MNETKENDFYALLEVPESASSEDIKARIHMLSLWTRLIITKTVESLSKACFDTSS
jgi:hypothetical protein